MGPARMGPPIKSTFALEIVSGPKKLINYGWPFSHALVAPFSH